MKKRYKNKKEQHNIKLRKLKYNIYKKMIYDLQKIVIQCFMFDIYYNFFFMINLTITKILGA